MPKVRIATIIERLDSNMRSALAEAVTEFSPARMSIPMACSERLFGQWSADAARGRRFQKGV